MVPGRNPPRRPGRRKPFRTVKKRILIVCEGAKSEPQYFRQFASAHREAIVEIEVVEAVGVPLSVVREARDRKKTADHRAKHEDSFYGFDSVWAVFDVDEHPNLPEALNMASDNGVKVALSNPCFELWLFLHLGEPPGEVHRHAIQKRLKKLVPDYDKTVRYETYKDGHKKAVAGAKSLDKLAERLGEPGRNPTTGVYKLTEEMLPPDGSSP